MIRKNKPLVSVIIGNENFDKRRTNLRNLTGVPADIKRVREFLSLYGIQSNEEIKRC